ncbi:hypothetical protein CQA53_11245, partial [Helicobacter didelphidarum]
TPENERLSYQLSDLPYDNNASITCIIDDTLHITNFHVELISSKYERFPTATIITKPCIYQDRKCPQVLRFSKKLWLCFNGKSLVIMQGNDIIQEFIAFSGNALNNKQKEQLQREKGYTDFVEYEEKGLSNNTTYYFCLDKEWQKEKDKGAIPEGEYYININDIKERRTIFSENTFGKHTSIYTDKECGNGVESHTQRENFYLSIYTDKDCSHTIESHTQREGFYIYRGDTYKENGGIDIGKNDEAFFEALDKLNNHNKLLSPTKQENNKNAVKLIVKYNSPIITTIQFLKEIEWELTQGQPLPITSKVKQKIEYFFDTEKYLPSYPFAPGTYIELEAKLRENKAKSSHIQWTYIAFEHDETKALDKGMIQWHLNQYKASSPKTTAIYKTITDESGYFSNNDIQNKIGFSLPLERTHKTAYKNYYVVIFAFDTSQQFPDIYDAHIVIDISFKVGNDIGKQITEQVRDKDYTPLKDSSDLIQWNSLRRIYDIAQAIEFLKANVEGVKHMFQNNQIKYTQKDTNDNPVYNVWFDYFRIHPQLAGKIAYIYYRFDVSDEKFIGSVKDNGEYVKDR